jgi:MFS family permease
VPFAGRGQVARGGFSLLTGETKIEQSCREPQKAVNRIALSRAVTFSGGNAAFIALIALLYEETDSATVAALGALASFAVPALVSPVAGWIGDRYDRRMVMVESEMLGAVIFLLMAAVPRSAVALLLLLRVFASIAAAPLVPATGAALPGIVGSKEKPLLAANARLTAAGISGGLTGPFVAAGLMLISDPGSVFLFNTATFLVSAVLLLTIKGDFGPDGPTEDHDRGAELVAGFRYLGRHQLLRPVTLAYGIIFVGVGFTAPAEVALSEDFSVGATGFAALTCLFALGGIAGSQVGKRTSVAPMAVLAASSAAMAAGFLVVGFAPVFMLALVGMAVSGAADGVWMVAHENLVQRVTPDAIRSRVFAGSEAVYLTGISVGLIVAGGLIAAVGAASTFKVGAVGSVLACLLLMGSAASIGILRRRGVARATPTAAALAQSARESLRRADERTV